MEWQRVYSDLWWRVASVVVAVGAVVTATMVALSAPAGFAAALVVLVVLRLVARARRASYRSRSGPPSVAPEVWRTWAALLVGSVGFVVAAIGWDALVGGVGDLIVVAVAFSGAPLVRRANPTGDSALPSAPRAAAAPRPLPESRLGPTEPVDSVPGSGVWPARRPPTEPITAAVLLPGLTDAELWHAWHASTRAMHRAPSAEVRLRIVAGREQYLNALVERDPKGFAAQLGGGGQERADDDWTSAGG